ncbi:MAG: LysM domain-containing protein [Planctomycetota bacterium]
MKRLVLSWPVLLFAAALLAAIGLHLSAGTGPALSKGPTHTVEEQVVLDVEAAGVSAPRTVVVQRGDTLGHIAQAQLGSARAWRAIAELNPRVNPDRLTPGTVLQLPPADAEAESTGHAFYLWQRDVKGPSGRLVALRAGHAERLGEGPADVLAVPLSAVRRTEAALREASAFGRPLPDGLGLVTGPVVRPVGAVPLGDETSRVVHRVRVDSVDDHALAARVEPERFDAKGRVIQPLPVASTAGRPFLLGAALLVLVVGVLALAHRLERRAALESFSA